MSENAAETADAPRSRVRWWRRSLIAVAISLALYSVAGFWLVPWLIRTQLPEQISRQFPAELTIGELRFNPFLLTLEGKGLTLAEKKTTTPAIRAGRLLIDLELSGLFRRAWTFREIAVEDFSLHAELNELEQLNLARLFTPRESASVTSDEQQADHNTALPRLVIQRLSVSRAAASFRELSLKPVATAVFDPINFTIEDVATLPDHQGKLSLSARLPGGGSLQWQGELSLAAQRTRGSVQLQNARLATPWRFVQDELAIAEPRGSFSIALAYELQRGQQGWEARLNEVAVHLKDLALAHRDGRPLARLDAVALEKGHFDPRTRQLAFAEFRAGAGAVQIVLDRDGKPDWGKIFRPAPAKRPASQPATLAGGAAAYQLKLPQIAFGPLAIAIQDNSRSKPVKMTIGSASARLALNATLGGQTQLMVSAATVLLKNLRASADGETEAPLTLTSAELRGGSFDLLKKSIRAENIRLAGGRTRVMRDAEGRLQLQQMFAPLKDSPTEDAGFATVIERIELADYAIAFSDQGYQPPLNFDFEQVGLTAGPVTVPAQKPVALDLSLRAKQGGRLAAKGSIDLKRSIGDLRLTVNDLALAPLSVLLQQQTTLTLVSGTAGTQGRLRWNTAKTPAAVSYTGEAVVANVDVQVAGNGERLFSWERLTAGDIAFDSTENRLSVAGIRLTRPYAKLIISKDRSTNLAAIRRPVTVQPQEISGAAPLPSVPASPMNVNIEQVSVERGHMDFSDLSLVLPFSTYIKTLGGSVNGLSSAPESRATLKFEGRIEEFGLARATGSIQPFTPKKFTDIAVTFRNVDLTPLSPYSATFAGRKIAAGKLSLDLQYKLENSQLAGDNRVVLDKFTLGERVESPQAVDLPLDLAVALLTDTDGRIDFAVPVTGNVDHPEFSYGHLVWQAIRTVIGKIVTAPLRALGALFGGGSSESLGDIVFDPGSARILPTEYEKLRRVAGGLGKRPRLQLGVTGQFHTGEDGLALRTQAVRAELAQREGLKLAKGEDPGPVSFDSPKVQRALELMLEARAGSDSVAAFVADYRKRSGRDAPRVNAALALIGRGAGDRELYIALHRRLVELQVLSEDALTVLGKARADAIVRALTRRLKVEAPRVTAQPAQAVDETAKTGVPVKLSFKVSGAATTESAAAP
jgi:uncharacterized protein involved in outer membrane biogenesis